MRKDSKTLAQEEQAEQIEKDMTNFGFSPAEREDVLAGTLTVEGVLNRREQEKAALLQAAMARRGSPEPDEPRAVPAGTLGKAASAVKAYATTAKKIATAETDALVAELEPVVEEAAKIKTELEAVDREHGLAIRAVMNTDFASLAGYRTVQSLVQTILRVVGFANGLLANSIMLAGIPARVRQVPYDGFPAAAASAIKRDVESQRGSAAQVVSYVRMLEGYMQELERRLAVAGEPVKLEAPKGTGPTDPDYTKSGPISVSPGIDGRAALDRSTPKVVGL